MDPEELAALRRTLWPALNFSGRPAASEFGPPAPPAVLQEMAARRQYEAMPAGDMGVGGRAPTVLPDGAIFTPQETRSPPATVGTSDLMPNPGPPAPLLPGNSGTRSAPSFAPDLGGNLPQFQGNIPAQSPLPGAAPTGAAPTASPAPAGPLGVGQSAWTAWANPDRFTPIERTQADYGPWLGLLDDLQRRSNIQNAREDNGVFLAGGGYGRHAGFGNSTMEYVPNFAPNLAAHAFNSILNNQLGQGQLGLQYATQFGTNGVRGEQQRRNDELYGLPGAGDTPAIPGLIQNRAHETETRYSPLGMANAAEIEALRERRRQGTISEEDYAKALERIRASGNPNTPQRVSPNAPSPPVGSVGQRAEARLNAALAAYPIQNGLRQLPGAPGSSERSQATDRIIMNYLGEFTPEELRGNYNTIIGGLARQLPDGAEAIQSFYRHGVGTYPFMDNEEERRRRQIVDRLRTIHNHGETTPSFGRGWWTGFTGGLGGRFVPTAPLPLTMAGAQ